MGSQRSNNGKLWAIVVFACLYVVTALALFYVFTVTNFYERDTDILIISLILPLFTLIHPFYFVLVKKKSELMD